MSLTTALEEQEKSPDKGWTYSCILSNSDSVSDPPALATETPQQTTESVIVTSSLEDCVEIESQEEESQVVGNEVIGGQVTRGQGINRGSVGTEAQQHQWSQQPRNKGEEGQIVENGGETVASFITVEDQPGLKIQGNVNENGQVVYRAITGANSGNQNARALLEKLLTKGNYQKLANLVNSTTAQSSAAPQTLQGTNLSQVQLGVAGNCAAGQLQIQTIGQPQTQISGQPQTQTTGQPQIQISGQLQTQTSAQTQTQTSGHPQTQTTGQLGTGLTIQNINSIFSQGKISKEDLVKLIKSRAAGGQKTQQSSPQRLQTPKIIQIQQAASPVTKTQPVLSPVFLTGTAQKIGAVSLARQPAAGSSIAELIQSKSNPGVVSLTSANAAGSPQSSTDSSRVKVVHVATPTTPVKQATTITNNEFISNLTLTNQQKVQTVGSPQTVTSGSQAVVIPTATGTTQYIIVNQGTPVQNINSPIVNQQQVPSVFNSPKTVPSVISGVRIATSQGTRPLRIVHTGPQTNEVQTLLARPRFSAGQSPTKVVIPQNLSALTSIVDNSSIISTQTVTIGIPSQTTVTPRMMSVGRGVMGRRGGNIRQPKQPRQTAGGRGKRQIRHNYFVDHTFSQQKGPVSGIISPGVENRVISTGNNEVNKLVPASQQVVIAGPANAMRLLQSNTIVPAGGGENVKQVKQCVTSPGEHRYASPCQGNSSLVDYSDSDSQSNSSEKCDSESASDLSQNSESRSVIPNKKVVMPAGLSEALVRAKPNEKILVDMKNYSVKFMKNVVYSISIRGQFKSYMYDGQYLVPSSAVDEQSLVGGGIGDRKERTLRGNATGLHMNSSQGNSTAKNFLKAAEATGKVFKDGRFWKHTGGPVRRAAGVDNNSNEDSGETASDSTSQENNQGRKRPIEDVSDLPPVEDDEMRVVHCKFCGYTSLTVRSCERCHRTFPTDTKIEIQKKKFKPDLEAEEGAPVISKQSFYGKPVTAPIVIHTTQVTNKAGNVMVLNYVNHGRRVNLDGKTYRSPSVIRGGKQSRKSYAVEPVTISISSDEEEEPEKPNVPGSTATGSIKSNGEDDIGELLDKIEQNKRSDSPTFPGGRMEKMEDEEGKPVIKRKNGRRKSPTRPPSCGSGIVNPPPESVDAAGTQKAEAVSHLNFNAKVIHIGSVLGCPIEPVVIDEDSISFYVECEENTHKFIIKPDQLQQCLYCLENRPVIFLKTTTEFAENIREMLKMNTPDSKNSFDPNDTVLKHQFISIVLLGMGSLTYPKLESVLNKYPKPEGTQFPFIVKMTGEQALVYLKEIQGEDGQPATPQPQERSPSPPKILFTGPVMKLITFPPPPLAGGIGVTNEDLSCLEEGEFLNDVIIDFYLKYLFLDVLSDRDRERTHIFSSFFFKRLTQRQGRCGLDDMADKTPAEKKHARVKNWTKKVDLFEKDFIFVPINEHSHWFLAVICFPGLMSNMRVTYLPKSTNVTQLTMTAQTVSNPNVKLAEKGELEKEPVKSSTGEPVKTLRNYKIPKLVKSGNSDGKSESESSNGTVEATAAVETKAAEEDNGENGEGGEEPMETDDSCLSDAQKQEIAEESEELMDTSVKQSEGDGSQASVEDQSTSNSQEVKKSETTNQNKATKSNLKTQVKDLRGRDLTETELNDPKILPTCASGCRQPCILVFDSLAGQNRSRIVSILKDYLQVEWDTKKKTPNILKERVRGCTATKVPQQTNFSDCGVYVLQYVESFFEDPIQDFSIPLKPLTDWFTEERVTAKRNEIKELVMRLKDKQQKDKS